MGLFDRLFKADPKRDLERAEKLFARGDAAGALRLAERIPDSSDASALAGKARSTLLAAALEKAVRAEESEYWEDAVEWIEGALEYADEPRRSQLRAHVETLLHRAEEARAEEEASNLRGLSFAGAAATPEEGEEVEAEVHYEVLMEMLRDDVAERYRDRPEVFRNAVVELNGNRPEAALPALEELADKDPSDPVLRLERGRCRLAGGDAEGARADLEAAWAELGPQPLDLAGNFSVPGLWAQAMLQLEEPRALVDRISEEAPAPEAMDPELRELYAGALLAIGEPEEALDFLGRASNFHPRHQELYRLQAVALRQLDERDEAIAVLEQAIAPSCATGNCARPPFHLPSLHLLATLLFEDPRDLERGVEVLELLVRASGGRLGDEGRRLLAAYAEKTESPVASRQATALLEAVQPT